MSSHHNQEHQDQTQAVIESIAKRERELQNDLEQAGQQAAKMVEDAKIKAEAIFKAARQEMEKQTEQHKKQLEQDSARIMEERLGQAARELEAFEKKAAGNREKAVQTVLNYVLPGDKA